MRKVFFSEEKKQKTFMRLSRFFPAACAQDAKVFLVLFFKKELLPLPEKLISNMRVRFAPSPTGYLHVGNARIALANYLFAKKHNAKFLLRVDDTDTERSKPEYEQGIFTDLAWLGITHDETFKQSDRNALYDAAAEKLRTSGRLYPCFESDEELRAKREMRLKRGLAPVYDRAMLKLTPEQRAQAEANGKRPYWRFKLSDTTVEWNDLVLKRKGVKLTAVSDPVLIRTDGTPLYTFTSVVDDIESGVTHIIRGEDHVTNTGVQLDIFSALNANPSRLTFAHLPLLIDSDGGKLSKRLDGLSLRALRQDGVEPTAITSYLARLGTPDSPEPLSLAIARRDHRHHQNLALAGPLRHSAVARAEPARAASRQLRGCARSAAPPAPPRCSGTPCAAISTCSRRAATGGTSSPATSCRRCRKASQTSSPKRSPTSRPNPGTPPPGPPGRRR